VGVPTGTDTVSMTCDAPHVTDVTHASRRHLAAFVLAASAAALAAGCTVTDTGPRALPRHGSSALDGPTGTQGPITVASRLHPTGHGPSSVFCRVVVPATSRVQRSTEAFEPPWCGTVPGRN
jgi:hypothetical protein